MRLSGILISVLASRALAVPTAGPESTAEPSMPDGLFQLPLHVVPAESEPDAGHHAKRQTSVGLDNLQYEGSRRRTTALGVVLEIGTPPQKVILEPDTGSSTLWVPGLQPGQVRSGPESTHFDKAASTSLRNLRKDIMMSYLSEDVFLDVFQDQVSFGGVPLGAFDFGIGNMSHPFSHVGRNSGVLGLHPYTPDYKINDFIPALLMEKKMIKTRAFSLSLRGKGRGALTFGGYDTSKFSGPLEKIAMQPTVNSDYIVKLQSVAVGKPNGSSEIISHRINADRMNVGLDSGAPVLNLPVSVGRELVAKLGGSFTQGGLLQVGCPVVDAKTTIDFKMTNSTTISVPLLDFVVDRLDQGRTCRLAIHKGSGTPAGFWVGGHFLRRSLVVFDPQDHSVYIGRGADCGSSLVVIDGNMPTDVAMGKCSDAPPDYDAAADLAQGIV